MSEAREIALAIADGSVPVIEGVVCLARTRSRLSLNHEETWDAFLPFVGSETDHLPLASERCNLNVESLRAKDEESRAYEERLRPALIADCATLVAAIEREAAYAPEFIVDGD